MFRSLRGRLVMLLLLLSAAARAAGGLMIGPVPGIGDGAPVRHRPEAGRACDAIAAAYRFYAAGWSGRRPALMTTDYAVN